MYVFQMGWKSSLMAAVSSGSVTGVRMWTAGTEDRGLLEDLDQLNNAEGETVEEFVER